MMTYVYRGHLKSSWYLYVDKADDFQRVPQGLVAAMGNLKLVLELELTKETRLARNNAPQVISDLQEKGYHLQINDALASGQQNETTH